MFIFLKELSIVNQLLNFYMHDEYTIKCNCKFLIIDDLKYRSFALNQLLIYLLL